MNTKDNILQAALMLFSSKGYSGTSMRELASIVGCKGSSIYNHFASKYDIWLTIVAKMQARYEEMMKSFSIPEALTEDAVSFYKKISLDNLVGVAKKLFVYFTFDEDVKKFRRMLALSRFEEGCASSYKRWFLDGPLFAQQTLFKRLIALGIFNIQDEQVLALNFFSPIYLLMDKYDGMDDKKEEALALLEKHVKQFSLNYTKQEDIK